MGNGAVLYRRMSTGVVLFSSLWLGFEALNPYSKAAPVVRVILLVVIVLSATKAMNMFFTVRCCERFELRIDAARRRHQLGIHRNW